MDLFRKWCAPDHKDEAPLVGRGEMKAEGSNQGMQITEITQGFMQGLGLGLGLGLGWYRARPSKQHRRLALPGDAGMCPHKAEVCNLGNPAGASPSPWHCPGMSPQWWLEGHSAMPRGCTS